MQEIARPFSVLMLLVASLARVGIAQVTTAITGANPAIVPVPRAEPWWVARHADRLEKIKADGYVKCLDLGYLFVTNGALNTVLFYDPRLKPARGPLHPDTVGQKRMAEAISQALYGDVAHS